MQALREEEVGKPKVEAVLKETEKKNKELREDTSLSREDRGPKMRTIMEDENKKLKEILTADQYKKHEESMARFRSGGKKGGEGKKEGGTEKKN